MNVLLTLTYSVFLNEPVNVALAVEYRSADLEERDTSAWTEVFEKVHAHAEVHLRLLVREPYLLNLCYCRLFHNLSCFKFGLCCDGSTVRYQRFAYPSSCARLRMRFWMSESRSHCRARRTVATPTPQSFANRIWHPRRSFILFLFAISTIIATFAY